MLDQLIPGFEFTSMWFKGDVKVIDVKKQINTVVVEITRASGHSHQEDWNLEHTIAGFGKREYIRK